MDISLIASSVRPHLWKEFFDSLQSNKCKWDVVFAGDLLNPPVYQNLMYIQTGRIKPAQCYEVARRWATGRYVMWVADDCEFSPGLLDDVVKYMDANDRKILLSVKTNENNTNNDLNDHRFFERNYKTPLMAPLGVINREYLEELGGFDRRYVCGQYENDVAMRVIADGGQVVKYEEGCVFIEHIRKHGESTKFWSGYDHDRQVLEDTWCPTGYQVAPKPYTVEGKQREVPKNLIVMGDEDQAQVLREIQFVMQKTDCLGPKKVWIFPIQERDVSSTPLMPFEPYSSEDILLKSQSYREGWE